MNSMTFWAWAAFVAIGLFTVVTWVFVARYTVRKPWRVTREGKTLLFMKVCLALFGTTLFLFRFVFDEPEWFGFRAFVWTVLFSVMTWQMVNFNRYLLKKENKDERSNSTTG